MVLWWCESDAGHISDAVQVEWVAVGCRSICCLLVGLRLTSCISFSPGQDKGFNNYCSGLRCVIFWGRADTSGLCKVATAGMWSSSCPSLVSASSSPGQAPLSMFLQPAVSATHIPTPGPAPEPSPYRNTLVWYVAASPGFFFTEAAVAS